jgi:hypothetical protein
LPAARSTSSWSFVGYAQDATTAPTATDSTELLNQSASDDAAASAAAASARSISGEKGSILEYMQLSGKAPISVQGLERLWV